MSDEHASRSVPPTARDTKRVARRISVVVGLILAAAALFMFGRGTLDSPTVEEAWLGEMCSAAGPLREDLRQDDLAEEEPGVVAGRFAERLRAIGPPPESLAARQVPHLIAASSAAQLYEDMLERADRVAALPDHQTQLSHYIEDEIRGLWYLAAEVIPGYKRSGEGDLEGPAAEPPSSATEGSICQQIEWRRFFS